MLKKENANAGSQVLCDSKQQVKITTAVHYKKEGLIQVPNLDKNIFCYM